MAKHIVSTVWLLVCVLHVFSQDLSHKANDFLQTLSPALKSQILFSMLDAERFNMNFIPIERKGPTFHDFNEVQKTAALALLRASLSQQGLQKTIDIMELEKVLIIIEKQAPESNYRDPLNYHFCIFGNPSATEPWGWRFEGHHISLNFASANGKIVSSTPSFLGSNPAIVKTEEQRGKQALKLETELGFALVHALSPDQLHVARFSDHAPEEIITGNKRKVQELEPLGISYAALTAQQKDIFMQLLDVYVQNYKFEFADTFMKKIKDAGVNNLHFGWAGGLTPGIPQYYRIQGPTLLIEYDNIQGNANHVHTVVRDLTNDFAEDILREHYLKEHR
ncbi:MAG TPA: DUF3500 domain-containing protein [Saprospiraceae bacterium]|nr:DUF3500 domain-containing protein [Saprospiraceae bacterium]